MRRLRAANECSAWSSIGWATKKGQKQRSGRQSSKRRVMWRPGFSWADCCWTRAARRRAIVQLRGPADWTPNRGNNRYVLYQAQTRAGDAEGARQSLEKLQQLKAKKSPQWRRPTKGGATGRRCEYMRLNSIMIWPAFLQWQGKSALAESHLRQLIAITPEQPVTCQRLATLCRQSGRLAEAKELFASLARLLPNEPACGVNLATVLLQLKDYAGAVQQGLERAPSSTRTNRKRSTTWRAFIWGRAGGSRRRWLCANAWSPASLPLPIMICSAGPCMPTDGPTRPWRLPAWQCNKTPITPFTANAIIGSRNWPEPTPDAPAFPFHRSGFAPGQCRRPGAPGQPCPIRFRDITEAAGIRFVHTDGSSGRHYFVEPYASGLGLIDYDGDGYLDILFLNGAPLPGAAQPSQPPTCALYHNNRDGTFTDVTASSGLGRRVMRWPVSWPIMITMAMRTCSSIATAASGFP